MACACLGFPSFWIVLASTKDLRIFIRVGEMTNSVGPTNIPMVLVKLAWQLSYTDL